MTSEVFQRLADLEKLGTNSDNSFEDLEKRLEDLLLRHILRRNRILEDYLDDSMIMPQGLKRQYERESTKTWSALRDILVTTFGPTWMAIGRLEAIIWNSLFELNIVLNISAPWEHGPCTGQSYRIVEDQNNTTCSMSPEADEISYENFFAMDGMRRPNQKFYSEEVQESGQVDAIQKQGTLVRARFIISLALRSR